MKWRDAWRIIRPLLWEGIRWYAPQISIPAGIVKELGKQLKGAKKQSSKIKRRIGQLDKIIGRTSEAYSEAVNEREDLILEWGDIQEAVDFLASQRKGRRGYQGKGRSQKPLSIRAASERDRARYQALHDLLRRNDGEPDVARPPSSSPWGP